MPGVITSTKNETVKSVARLKRTKERTRTGSILVEGPNGFTEALDAGMDPVVVLATEDDDATRTRLEDYPAVDVHLVTQSVLDSVADAAHPRSPVMVVHRPDAGRIRLQDTVLLVGVRDPGNAGTIIRTAAAFGWDVAYTPDCVDMWSPKTLRSGAGAHFRTRLIPIDLDEDVDALEGHTVVATVVSGGDRGVDAAAPIALLIGSEAHGLDNEHVAMAAHRLTIEMEDSTESLNVSVAAAIAMHLLR
jgi:TrmH family RNA methyltransferase